MIKKNKLDNRGFTILELLTVVALVGILSALAFPALMSSVPALRLKIETRNFARQMQLMRLKAVSTNKRHRIIVTNNAHPTPDSYRVERSEDGDFVSTSSVVPETQIPVYANIDAMDITGNTVTFLPNGTIDTANNGELIHFNLDGSSDREYRIEFYSPTGKITLIEE